MGVKLIILNVNFILIKLRSTKYIVYIIMVEIFHLMSDYKIKFNVVFEYFFLRH